MSVAGTTTITDLRPKADKDILDRHRDLMRVLAGPRRALVALPAEFAPAATYARGRTYFIAVALSRLDGREPFAAGDIVVEVMAGQVLVRTKGSAPSVAERRRGRFGLRARQFALPVNADHTKARASYAAGVLTIAVPLKPRSR
jgi:hypothetical protein